MSVATLYCRAQVGTSAPAVIIEVFLSGGLPGFSIVGMPEAAVRESKDRVRGALMSCGFRFPQERITVSLGPADMRKQGGRYDLAIALGILKASRQIRTDDLETYEFYGELSLSGELRTVPGVLCAGIAAHASGRELVVPEADADDASRSGATIYAAAHLLQVTEHLSGNNRIPAWTLDHHNNDEAVLPDLAEVRGQLHAKRALEIAAAGNHNLLLSGPPGTGKTMLAKRLPSLLPPLTESESLELACVQSVSSVKDKPAWSSRPFRAPHHTASAAALVGGGSPPRPGEISRAHKGVLFLDEFPEFNRNVLEVLREPLEAGVISIARANYQVEFPASVQLVAAMNPCPCGFHGDEQASCRCSADRVQNYRAKISGPLLDRIDLHIEVRRQGISSLRKRPTVIESSKIVAARVAAARAIANERQACTNAELTTERTEAVCKLTRGTWSLLEEAADRLLLSTRSVFRLLRVARTIADLEENDAVKKSNVLEALSYRRAW